MTTPEPLVTCATAAQHLGVALQTLYDWRKHGRGPKGYRIEGRVMFRLSEIDAWIAARREEPVVRPVRSLNRQAYRGA